jgi:hypothetical protein
VSKNNGAGPKNFGRSRYYTDSQESRTRGSDKHGIKAKRLEEEAEWMRQHWAKELANDPYYSPYRS